MSICIQELDNIITTLEGCQKNINEEILLNRITYSLDILKNNRNKKVRKYFCNWKDTKKGNTKLQMALYANLNSKYKKGTQ